MAKGRAPGKVIICGEHAVVHGSPALAAAIGMYTEAETNRGEDGKVCLVLVDIGLDFEWPLESIATSINDLIATDPLPRSCSQQVKMQLQKLIQNHDLPSDELRSGVTAFLFLYCSIVGVKPGTVKVESKLPIGAGLGSSAAYSVAIAASLLAYTHQVSTGVSITKGWMSVADEDVKLINDWAFQAEKIIHGTPSGIDNTVSSYGKVVKLENSIRTFLNDLPTFKTLITNTKVPRSTKQLVTNVRLLKDKHPEVMSAVFQAVGAVSEEFLRILQSGTKKNCESGNENGLCENKREQETRLEELFAINQALLQAMGVSHPSIQSVCDITAKYNLKSKLTGAGGGGCVISFIPENFPEEILDKAITELTAAGFQCFQAELGSEGAQISF